MLLVGVLKRKMDYGIFVNMLNNLTGLAPNKVPYIFTNKYNLVVVVVSA